MDRDVLDPHRLLDAVPQMVWSVTAEGVGDYVNRPLLEFLGRPLDRLVRGGWLELVHPQDRERVWAVWRRAIAAGTEASGDLRLRRADDGAYRWCHAALLAERGEDGRPCRWYGTITDIDVRKRMEARLGALLGQLPVGVIVADAPSGHVTLSNAAASAILGRPVFPCEQIESYTRAGAVHEDGRPYAAHEYPLARAVRGESFAGEELTLPGGRCLSVNGAPIHDAGHIGAGVIVFTDVTEQRQMADALAEANARLARSNAELEHFTHAVSHDLKAPLRAVSSLAGMLQEHLAGRGDAEAEALLTKMQARLEHMGEMVDGLLDYARAGREQMVCQPLSIPVLVEEVVAGLEVPPGFAVCFVGEPLDLCAVRVHLMQVLQNLIGNAIRHHDGDAGRIEVSIERAGSRWRFRVADDGPGIPAAERERVFNLFATVAGRPSEGSGLGLAIVRKLLHDLDCAIRIDDNTPRGAAVMFEWPVRCATGAT